MANFTCPPHLFARAFIALAFPFLGQDKAQPPPPPPPPPLPRARTCCPFLAKAQAWANAHLVATPPPPANKPHPLNLLLLQPHTGPTLSSTHTPPAAQAMSGTETEAARKWLTMDKDQSSNVLCVDESATASLRALGPVALSLIMVCGRARTGKSFLMNMLMEQPGFFTVRSGQDPTTVGADLSSFKPYSDFAGSAGGCGVGGQVGFVDVEGQGDRGPKNDMMLAAPLLLVSKAVIFNWKGEMARDEMLDKLGVLAEVARRIRADGNAAGHYRIFGHLHVVMRDQASIEGVFVRLFEDEKCSATDAAAVERNTKRAILRQSFASIRVWGFPAPVELTKDLNAGKFTEAHVLPTFVEALKAFKTILVQQLSEPLALCGRILSAADVAEFVPLLAAAMNAGQEEFVPQSMFGQMDQRRAQAAASAAIATFDAWKATIHESMPMPMQQLNLALQTQEHEGVSQITERLVGLPDGTIQFALDQLVAHVARSKEALVVTNEREIRVKVDAAKALAFADFEALAAAVEEMENPLAEETLRSDFETKEAAVLLAFAGATDAFSGVDAVIEGHREVQDKAVATWAAMLRRNQQLDEQALATERIAASEERAEEAEVAREEAEEAKKQAAIRLVWAGVDLLKTTVRGVVGRVVGMGRGGGGGGGGPLYRQPAGTVNARGSMSLGVGGLTVDRNNNLHNHLGQFVRR